MKISTSDGSIEFAGGRVDPALTRTDFLATPLGRSADESMRNENWTRYSLRPESGISATLVYDGSRLDRMFLLMDLPDEEGREWTESLELERKELHDSWLEHALGNCPYVYSWGHIASHYDARGCVSEIIAVYGG